MSLGPFAKNNVAKLNQPNTFTKTFTFSLNPQSAFIATDESGANSFAIVANNPDFGGAMGWFARFDNEDAETPRTIEFNAQITNNEINFSASSQAGIIYQTNAAGSEVTHGSAGVKAKLGSVPEEPNDIVDVQWSNGNDSGRAGVDTALHGNSRVISINQNESFTPAQLSTDDNRLASIHMNNAAPVNLTIEAGTAQTGQYFTVTQLQPFKSTFIEGVGVTLIDGSGRNHDGSLALRGAMITFQCIQDTQGDVVFSFQGATS